MLNDYFKYDPMGGEEGVKRRKRLLAVQAALEIAKVSVSSAGGNADSHKVMFDLQHLTEKLSDFADAIQDALEDNDTENE